MFSFRTTCPRVMELKAGARVVLGENGGALMIEVTEPGDVAALLGGLLDGSLEDEAPERSPAEVRELAKRVVGLPTPPRPLPVRLTLLR